MKILSTLHLYILLCIIAFASFSGCSSKKIDEGNPQDLIHDAEEDIADKRYTVALEKLKSIKNKFPYNNLSTLAQLRIADVYFMEDAFIEAAGAYESFRDLHPKHEKADYVLFRIGESHFYQLPGGEDRDLTPATKAIEAYRELLTLYPKSEFAENARKHLNQSSEMLSEKERYIADFYYIREMYDSAALRYEKITNQFADTKSEEYAYWKLGLSLRNLDKIDEAKHTYRVYLSKFPSGKYARNIGDWLEKNN